MKGLVRYWQTLRHLRPVQFHGRLWFRFARPRPDEAPAPPRRNAAGVWTMPARRQSSLTAPGSFTFLSVQEDLARIGWDGPECEKLWRYNQHYFDDLNAQGWPERAVWHRGLITGWVHNNPPGAGTGWEPYPASLRIVNWIKWALAGNPLEAEWAHSLAVQARWLERRLEWHLLGNHLFANAKALVFAGLFFDGSEAQRWLDKGLRIIARELPEQILGDGGQFELSPLYHALALEDLLDLANLLRGFGVPTAGTRHCLAACEQRIPAMLAWLEAMSHPDGRIALFNDAAFAIAPDNAELAEYARRLGFDPPDAPAGQTWLEASGYARLTRQDAVLIADMARIGPDYLPGHAHADTLSFEFSLGKQRIFVNSGTSLYGTGPERLRQRGTPAHNTVAVAGENSSDVWAGFRVGRRARPLGARLWSEGDALLAEAGHDGYHHLPGRPRHDRCWTFSPGRLVIEDRLSVPGLPAEARFHLHPGVEIRPQGADHGLFVLPDGRELRWRCEGQEVRIEESSWHPEFGISLPGRCLAIPLCGGHGAFELRWN